MAHANQLGARKGWQQRSWQLGGIGGDPQSRFGWIIGHDGKARRVPESGIRLLADGPSSGLAILRTIEDRAIQEVINYGEASQTDADEVLRAVRQVVRTEACWQGKPTGMRVELPSAEVLLNFLLCISPACQTKDGRGVAKALEETQLRIVRRLRERDGDGCSPYKWQSTGQHADESSDTLLALSFVLARHAAAYQQVAREAHASLNRVGMLRALGNAIDPRPAAAFITAYMQARSLIS